MAARGKDELKYPSSSLVKYLKVAASAVAVASVVLDILVPVAQQLGKPKPAKEGLDSAIRLSVLMALARGVPRLIGAVRTLRTQLAVDVSHPTR